MIFFFGSKTKAATISDETIEVKYNDAITLIPTDLTMLQSRPALRGESETEGKGARAALHTTINLRHPTAKVAGAPVAAEAPVVARLQCAEFAQAPGAGGSPPSAQ